MSVEFEEPNFNYNRISPTSDLNSGPMIRMLIKTGIVKNKSQANAILIGLAIVFLLLSFFIVGSYFSNKRAPVGVEGPTTYYP